MTDTVQKRIEWIDEFKGFVLLLVCLFHVEQSFKFVEMGTLHLSVMRMSAFFFISGVLFSTRRFSDFKSYAIHKTKVLLLPYIFLSLLFLLLDPVLYNFDWYARAPKMTVMTIRPEISTLWDYFYWNLAKIFVAGKSSIGSGPLWFIFTLYSISLMFFGIQKFTKFVTKNGKHPIVQKCFVAIIAAASLTGGWILYKNHIRLPFGIERDLTTLCFFAGGWLCKDFIKNLGKLKAPILLILSALFFTLYGLVDDANPWFSVMNNDLGKSFWIFFGGSLLGILGLVAFFQFLSQLPHIAPLKIVKGVFRNIARNGLIVLAVHWWVLLVLRIVFKAELDKPGMAYLSIPITAFFVFWAIPLFRCKLYRLIGKEKISFKESISIR